jgi:hypothetical protein
MATINPTIEIIDDNVTRFYWAALTTTNADGAPIPARFMDFADRTVQVTGTFGDAGNLRVQGANEPDSPVYAALNDPQGNDLNIGAAKIEQIVEVTPLTRPLVTAGDGTTNLNVSIICRRSRSGQEI